MTQAQENYLNMMNTVIKLFDQNPAIELTNPAMELQVRKIRRFRDDIVDTAFKQKNSASKGHTEAKERSRTALETKIYIIGVRFRIYATVIGNDIIASKLSFSRSSLSRMKTHTLMMLGRVIAESAEPLLEELKEYQILENMLNDILNNIDDMAALYTERDTVVDGGMEATKHLSTLIKDVRKAFKLLDDIVDGYILDETFKTTYYYSRKIHDIR